MTAYYNEIDPFAAEWLRNLIKAGHIAPGDVDERSIEDVRPDDLKGYAQCHFFAGIGVWSHALRKSGWEDDRPVWTGSCPCQSFSSAGQRKGFADERHLWPAWHHLITQRRPPVIFGEQVSSKDAMAWLDLVQADLEGLDYACGPLIAVAAGVGAPHIRSRLYFAVVADASREFDHGSRIAREERRTKHPNGRPTNRMALANGEQINAADAGGFHAEPGGSGFVDGLAHHHHHERLQGRIGMPECTGERAFGTSGLAGRMEYADVPREHGRASGGKQSLHFFGSESIEDKPASGPINGFWGNADWLFCRDGKWRPVESGSFPLAHGIANRMGLLRGYGNAIVAEQAVAFIESFKEISEGFHLI